MNETGSTTDRALIVQLELHLERQPLCGRLRDEQGVEQAFVGWLGFVEALQRLQALGGQRPHPGAAGLTGPSNRKEAS